MADAVGMGYFLEEYLGNQINSRFITFNIFVKK